MNLEQTKLINDFGFLSKHKWKKYTYLITPVLVVVVCVEALQCNASTHTTTTRLHNNASVKRYLIKVDFHGFCKRTIIF